jgi:hypothetical protein
MRPSHKFLGSLAVGAFVLLFSAGLFLDSQPYVDALKNVNLLEPAHNAASATAAEHASLPAVSLAGVAGAGPPPVPDSVRTFFYAVVLYPPTNALLLTLLAGFLGGCTSNLAFDNYKARLKEKQEEAERTGKAVEATEVDVERAAVASESPFASMIRSLVVYLLFMAGMFITSADPFDPGGASQAERAGQYVRFATTITAFAFAVGFDPKRLTDLIGGVPGLKPRP